MKVAQDREPTVIDYAPFNMIIGIKACKSTCYIVKLPEIEFNLKWPDLIEELYAVYSTHPIGYLEIINYHE